MCTCSSCCRRRSSLPANARTGHGHGLFTAWGIVLRSEQNKARVAAHRTGHVKPPDSLVFDHVSVIVHDYEEASAPFASCSCAHAYHSFRDVLYPTCLGKMQQSAMRELYISSLTFNVHMSRPSQMREQYISSLAFHVHMLRPSRSLLTTSGGPTAYKIQQWMYTC